MFDLKLLVSAITLVVIDSMYLNIIKSYFLKQITLVQGTPVKLNFLAIIMAIFISKE